MSSQAPAPGWYADPTGQHPTAGGTASSGPTTSRPGAGRPSPRRSSGPRTSNRPRIQQQHQPQPGTRPAAERLRLFESRALVVSQKAKLIELTNEYDINDASGACSAGSWRSGRAA